MLFENDDFDLNMAIFMPDVNFNQDVNLVDPMEGFLRGNMFKDEYLPYKNLTYFKLSPCSEKDAYLLKIMALSFAVNDLNLYLDLHPDDRFVFEKFKKYGEELKNLSKEYAKVYGPLELTQTKGNKYDWLDSPWPWDAKGGSLYV